MVGRARFGGLQRWEAIVLGLSMAAMIGWSVGRRAPRSGFIAVNVEPADAIVLVDDVKVGPGSTVERWPGSYTVSVMRDGYQRRDQIVEVAGGRVTPVKVALEASADTGFDLTSEPPGLPVWLDGRPLTLPSGGQTRTDFRAFRISPGHHVIELRGDGLKVWKNDILVEAGSIKKVHAVMVPLDRQPESERGAPRAVPAILFWHDRR